MKFPVDKCDCGLDLTTAEPAEVHNFDNGVAIGTCPLCGRPHYMTEVTPPPSPEPAVEPEVIPEPEPPRVRAGRRRAPESEQPAEEVPPEEPGAEEKPSEKSEPEE
ncbi:hypothetical protein ES703_67263 [subsurface metagenome]